MFSVMLSFGISRYDRVFAEAMNEKLVISSSTNIDGETISIDGISDFCIFNQAAKLHHGGRQNTHSQHGCGRWVRCFQNAVYQNRAAIDYLELKKHICAENKNVKYTENQDAAVNLADALSLYPLD